MDGSCAPAKSVAAESAKPSEGKGTQLEVKEGSQKLYKVVEQEQILASTRWGQIVPEEQVGGSNPSGRTSEICWLV